MTKPYNIESLPSRTFGRLTVTGFAFRRKSRVFVYCNCECGTQRKALRVDNLTCGGTISCGCFTRERAKSGIIRRTHGMRGCPEYLVWAKMHQRCGNPNDPKHSSYGGRGIAICKAWFDFATFYADMGPRPSTAHSIGRIDNDGNYEPENCRWETAKQQANNRSDSLLIEANGETLTQSQWADRLGVDQRYIYTRIRRGWSPERAVTEPIRVYRK